MPLCQCQSGDLSLLAAHIIDHNFQVKEREKTERRGSKKEKEGGKFSLVFFFLSLGSPCNSIIYVRSLLDSTSLTIVLNHKTPIFK